MFTRNEIGDVTTPPTRTVYQWSVLEEYHPDGGMWRIPTSFERPRYVHDSADLMANSALFADAMRSALRRWPKSCAVAMTTPGLNRRAWIGRAGCYLATGSPEEATRLGWHELDAPEQYGANAAADTVIAEWTRAHRPDPGQMLLWGDDLTPDQVAAEWRRTHSPDSQAGGVDDAEDPPWD